MLAALKQRYGRLPYEELQTAASEQMKITELRLRALFGAGQQAAEQAQRRADQVLTHLTATSHAAAGPPRSPITTHVLDTATGAPARGLPLTLSKQDEVSKLWDVVNHGVTNEDGRVGGLLPAGNYIVPGRYRMHFDTAAYLTACQQAQPGFYSAVPFYPEVRASKTSAAALGPQRTLLPEPPPRPRAVENPCWMDCYHVSMKMICHLIIPALTLIGANAPCRAGRRRVHHHA